jgi:hypothetical protein
MSAAANPVMGLIRHPRSARPADEADYEPIMPVRDPSTTLAEIAATASARLPGATIRRRLFFRYTLGWGQATMTTRRQSAINSAHLYPHLVPVFSVARSEEIAAQEGYGREAVPLLSAFSGACCWI